MSMSGRMTEGRRAGAPFHEEACDELLALLNGALLLRHLRGEQAALAGLEPAQELGKDFAGCVPADHYRASFTAPRLLGAGWSFGRCFFNRSFESGLFLRSFLLLLAGLRLRGVVIGSPSLSGFLEVLSGDTQVSQIALMTSRGAQAPRSCTCLHRILRPVDNAG